MNYQKILLGLLSSFVGSSVAFSAPTPGGVSASGHVFYVLYSGSEDVGLTGNPQQGLTSLETDFASFTTLPPLVAGDSFWVRGISADGSVQFGESGDTAVLWKNGVVQSIAPIVANADNVSSNASLASANGSVVAGNVNYQLEGDYKYNVFRWTSAGSVLLPNLTGDYSGNLRAMTSDGSTLIGSSYGGGLTRAVFWRDNVVTNIHPVAMDGGSDADYVSDNGSVIGINARTADYDSRAYRWKQADGSVALGHLSAGANSYSYDMSSSGAVIVGAATVNANNTVNHAFRWTESGGMQDIHPTSIIAQADQYDSSSAQFVSRDGVFIFGEAYLAGNVTKVFRWTENAVIDLGSFGGNQTFINAITPDGKVAVGNSFDGNSDQYYGFRWTESGGMQTIQQWLAEAGVVVSDDIRVNSAQQISADGSVVFGYLEDGPFVARATGLITIADLQQSISQTAAAVSSLRNSASLVLNGAHGHPLSRRADEGRFIAWAGGDYGADDHGERDGSLSVAEVGGGYNFGPAQLNLAIGRSDSSQDTVFDGNVDHDGIFLISDVIVPVPSTPLIVTLTGIYQSGDLDVRRGYLNAGLPDSSRGDTDTEVFGGALRVDWADAFRVGEVSFTPFTKLVITRAKVDGFSETGGGFPAVFKTQRDTISDLHLGADASYRLSQTVRLVATLEGVYRFQDNASSSSVSVPGVTTGFTSLAGEDYKQFWVSGGVGAEYDIGNGTLSVTLNGSSDSPTSNLWLASSYQYKF